MPTMVETFALLNLFEGVPDASTLLSNYSSRLAKVVSPTAARESGNAAEHRERPFGSRPLLEDIGIEHAVLLQIMRNGVLG